MDSLLTHSFRIANHPICELKAKFRIQYVMALGEFGYFLSKKDRRAKLLVEVWAHSIVPNTPNSFYAQTEDTSNIKSVISLKRDGLHFFFMRRIFFFDCLYLATILDTNFLEYTYSFLRNTCKGLITKRILDTIYLNWDTSEPKKIPLQLLEHRRRNISFNQQPLKRILVVATMSAGKSTLINALTGHPINKVAVTACTNDLYYIYNWHEEEGNVMKQKDGSIQYHPIISHQNIGEFSEVALHFHSQLSDLRICFIDTPGVNYARAKQHKTITYDAIKKNEYEAVLFVSNSNYFETDDEIELLRYVVSHTKKPIIFVLNKVDTFKQGHDSIGKMLQRYENYLNKLKLKSTIVPISSEAALFFKTDANHLNSDDYCLYEQYKKKFSQEYYDLPSYCTGKSSNKNLLDRTGITLLENIIKSTIQ